MNTYTIIMLPGSSEPCSVTGNCHTSCIEAADFSAAIKRWQSVYAAAAARAARSGSLILVATGSFTTAFKLEIPEPAVTAVRV